MKKIKNLKMSCHVCGGNIGKFFFLSSPARLPPDRVFIICDEKEHHSCINQLDSINKIQPVVKNP